MIFNNYSNNGPSTSSSEDDSFLYDNDMSPTKLLTLAIDKRRSLFNKKARDYRCELLQTTFITSLCKHMGESRKRRRRGGKKRSRNDLNEDSSLSTPTTVEYKPISNGEPLVQTESPLRESTAHSDAAPKKKRCKVETYADPFGLDEFFKSMRTNSSGSAAQS